MENETLKLKISEIGEDVRNLREKIKTCNVPIDSYAINRIVAALQSYQDQIRKSSDGGKSDILLQIRDAMQEIKSVPRKPARINCKSANRLQQVENNVKAFNIDVCKCNEISATQFDSYVAEIIEMEQFSQYRSTVLGIDEKYINLLLLEMFTKLSFPPVSPPPSVQELYDALTVSVIAGNKCLKPTPLSVEEMVRSFEEFLKLNKQTNLLVEKLGDALRKPTHGDPNTAAKNGDERTKMTQVHGLPELEEAVGNFQSSSESHAFKQLTRKINRVNESLHNIPQESKQMCEMRTRKLLESLATKARQNDERLQNVQHLERIKRKVEEALSDGSSATLTEKELVQYRDQIQSIIDPELHDLKKETVKKVQDYEEVLMNLKVQELIWQSTDAVCKHKALLNKPRDAKAYKRQQQEIAKLGKRITKITPKSTEMENKKRDLLEDIAQMVRTLTRKITEATVDTCLKELALIEKKVDQVVGVDPVKRMAVLEKCRRRLAVIDVEDERVTCRKRELEDTLATVVTVAI